MVKKPLTRAGDADLIPRSGRCPKGGNGNRPQYSCQENLMDRGGWWALVHGIAKSQTQLSDLARTQTMFLAQKTEIVRMLIIPKLICRLNTIPESHQKSHFLK